MKNLLHLIFVLFTINSFSQKNTLTSVDTNAFLNAYGSRMYIPKQSSIEWSDHSFTVVPPVGWSYVFQTVVDGERKTQMKNGNAGVSCDCILNENGAQGGCHPELSNQGAFGCKMTEECNTCQKKVTLTTTDQVYALEMKGSGYVNGRTGIDFASNTDSLPLAFAAMFEIPEIKDSIDRFIERIYGGIVVPELTINESRQLIPPDGYVFNLVNVFGRAAAVLLPESAMVEGRIVIPRVECKCEISGTCDPFPNGPVITCYSTCQGACKLEVQKEQLRTYMY